MYWLDKSRNICMQCVRSQLAYLYINGEIGKMNSKWLWFMMCHRIHCLNEWIEDGKTKSKQKAYRTYHSIAAPTIRNVSIGTYIEQFQSQVSKYLFFFSFLLLLVNNRQHVGACFDVYGPKCACTRFQRWTIYFSLIWKRFIFNRKIKKTIKFRQKRWME